MDQPSTFNKKLLYFCLRKQKNHFLKKTFLNPMQ